MSFLLGCGWARGVMQPPVLDGADDDEASLSAPALLSACASGGEVIVLRAPFRTSRLFAEELHAAAGLAFRFGSDRLRCLSSGLLLLSPGEAPGRDRLLAWLDALGGVRLRGALVAAAPHPAALVAAARASRDRARRAPRWSLAYETAYPAAEHAVVPFVRMHAAPALIIGLHNALGASDYVDAWGAVGGDGCEGGEGGGGGDVGDVDRLIVLHCKHWLLLVREHPLNRRCPAWPPSETPGGTELDGSADAERAAGVLAASDASCKRCPWWISPWASRSFSFSASLDPLIAVAALNLAASTHRAPTGPHGGDERVGNDPFGGVDRGPLRGLRVYDPCCGSGTILMAAVALGAAGVAGSDVNENSVAGARENLMAMGAIGVTEAAEATEAGAEDAPWLFVHDASQPLGNGQLPSRSDGGGGGGGVDGGPAWCDVVVSNPPWGKNMGKPEDGGPIVLSVRRASSRIGPPETPNAPGTGGHDFCLFVGGWLLRRFAVSFEA